MPRKPKPFNLKLAEALKAAKKAARNGHVLKSKDLDWRTRELLTSAGWLVPIYAGWYVLGNPSEDMIEESTVAYYSNYWEFLSKYLDDRLGDRSWCLGPLASLKIWTDDLTIPTQISIQTMNNINDVISFPHDSSAVITASNTLNSNDILREKDLNILKLERVLSRLPLIEQTNPSPSTMAVLAMIKDTSKLAKHLIDENNKSLSGRLIALLELTGNQSAAKELARYLRLARFEYKEDDIDRSSRISFRPHSVSIVGTKYKALWQEMSQQIRNHGTPQPKSFRSFEDLKELTKKKYVKDAYNSLSIEGYQVTEEQIGRIARGEYNAGIHDHDKNIHNALAAKGYHLAFNSVLTSLEKIVTEKKPVYQVVMEDLMEWRSLLFQPYADSGLLKPSDLIGYRSGRVNIRGSRHTPLPPEKILDAMEALQENIREEENPWVRALLAHHQFVNIHPFCDGNGRTARFLMNVLFVSSGFPWVIIDHTKRTHYFDCLEAAHIENDGTKFSDFIRNEIIL
ncbi:MAG: Fic family protein [Oligoflexus sp.]